MNEKSTQVWKRYWNDKKSPLHREDSEGFYFAHAAEFTPILQRVRCGTVLEVGCGNGALFECLGFKDCDYTGVDFSETMISVFRQRQPSINLFVADGSMYLDERKYDVIFSNGVIQYFDDFMLSSHFYNARKMMHKDSILVCGSIPWIEMRDLFYSGALYRPYKYRALMSLKSKLIRIMRGSDGLGYWRSFSDIADLAAKFGMSVDFFSSANYLYRFHAVLSLHNEFE